MSDRTDLGARIRQLRGKLLSQHDLASRAQVSVDLIRKLEQGRRHTASVPSLQRIARALDVSVADLLGKQAAVPSRAPHAGVVAIRQALTPVDDLVGDVVEDVDVLGDAELALEEAERAVTYLWGAYWSGRYELLVTLVPNAIAQARATLRAVPTAKQPRAAHILARAYQVAGDTLVHLGHLDIAWLGIRLAIATAQDGADPLCDVAPRVSAAWHLLVQGRYDESERVALSAAHTVEPTGEASDSQLAAYGILMVTGATAAARAHRSSATDLLAEATAAAGRLGYDRVDHQTTFGPAKIGVMAVDVAVVQDDFTGALAAASRIADTSTTLPAVARARHLSDVAFAHLRLGHGTKALHALLAAERTAPDWMRFQRFPQAVTAELLHKERRVPTPLRELAIRLRVSG
ncbi:helix-turn-helix domain-containing protein [Actinokineospora sp. NPDC004072]